VSGGISAQKPGGQPYKPTVGMEGKDAVWVPTTAAMVEKMLDVAKVTPKDYLIALGSGDGRMVIAAAKRGVPALGVEFNPDLVELSKQEAKKQGVADKASFLQGDMFAADVSKASVMALFLLPGNIEKLSPKFLNLKPGSRIVANTFWVQGWEADETTTLEENCDNWCTVLLFIIPAKVAGKWRIGKGELALSQTYQMVEGSMSGEGGPAKVKGRLRGDRVMLTVGQTEYEGRVNGDTMDLSAKAPSGRSPSKLIASRMK
jgi:precorrin-6B methylase 2